jgi:prepilin signal peptidase PulO-like enzyme (type II secretory pathway)
MITAFFVFIFGACIGSFLSVILHRTRTNESFCRGRSKCPKCAHILAVFDLIPLLSWVFCGGKCRYCKKPVSWQYPALELALGTAFTLVYYFRHPDFSLFLDANGWINLVLSFVLISAFALIFVYDARYGEVPDIFSLVAIAVGLAGSIATDPVNFWKYLLAAAIGAGFFGAQFLLSGGKWIGSGDILIGAAMGAATGLWGLAIAIFIAYNVGLVVTAALLILKKKTLKSTIPLGPFLAIGVAVVIIMNLNGRIFGFYG